MTTINNSSKLLGTANKAGRSTFARSIIKGSLALSMVQIPVPALACTTVAIPQSSLKLVGKSYDWDFGSGLVVTNKRHVKKTGLALFPLDQAATWTSRYGSLSFNQYGREFPNGGINEKGLVVELMWLNNSVYPQPSDKSTLNELQWIEYQLDNFATVAEIVAAAPSIDISKVYAPVHYMACDASGACASFEYIDGKWAIHAGSELPIAALTNNTYADSAAYAQGFVGLGGAKALPQGQESLSRFVRAAASAQAYKEESPAASYGYMMQLLAGIGQGDYSKWNIVYSSATGHVSFRSLNAPQIKELNAFGFDYSCKTPVRILDINTPGSQGTAVQAEALFSDYSEKANRDVIQTGVDQLQANFPDGLVDLVAHYPETTQCLD